MTDTPKLPTREDGGIDWDKIIYPNVGHQFYGWVGSCSQVTVFDFHQMVATHERERCALYHNAQEKIALEYGYREIATWHRLYADAIRNLKP